MKLTIDQLKVLVMKSFQEMESLPGFEEYWVNTPPIAREEVTDQLVCFCADMLEVD